MAHFAFEDLTFSYPGVARPALAGVTLSVRRGEFVCLCGKSGCGKTTLVRQLKPVIAPHGARVGRVLFDGAPIEDLSPRDQASRIGFVTQDPDAQIVTDKVWHELAFGLESLGTDEREMRVRVAEMASYFGIEGWFHRDVRDLSGGQKQLLNLASVMAMRPEALVLDEPTSQLDPIAASDFLGTVRKINLELGTTVVVTEHRLEELFSLADRVVVLDAGRVAADGAPRDVADELHARRDDMAAALPAPLRVSYAVEPAAPGATSPGEPDAASPTAAAELAESAPGAVPGKPARPLTVREGRSWLSARFADAPPQVRALPDPDSGSVRARPVLEAKDVWLRYGRDEPDVLRGLSLDVSPGEIHAIVGGNGAGKSTLLRAWCGIERPYRGTLRVAGRKLRDWRRGELFRGCLAMVPQDPRTLFACATVRADLAEMLEHESLDDAERAEQIAQVAETAGIAHLLDAHPYDVSGGELQRAALAKALLCDPRILLLDEPTKGIDAFFKGSLARVLRSLAVDGRTIVMATHDVEFCARHADRVSMLFDGAITTTGAPRRFFSRNSFYTTAANRMSRHVFDNAVTDEDVVELCRAN